MEEPQDVIANRLLEMLIPGRNSSNATITVNAGGFGVWVAVTCCIVMLSCNIFLAVIVMDHSRQISDLKDYLSAIYMQAPYLKPSEKKE